MSTELELPDNSYAMNPEMVAVATKYLEYSDSGLVASVLHIPVEKVVYYLNKPEVKRFINSRFLEQGCFNRDMLQRRLSEVIEKKFVEMEEAEIGSSKDIAELIALAHKMRMDEIKAMQKDEDMLIKKETPKQVGNITQINNRFGDNYNSLLDKILDVK